MPKGVYERSENRIHELTTQIKKIKPEQLRGVSHGGKFPRGSESFKQLLREDRKRYARTPKGRFQHLKTTAKSRNIELSITCEDLESIRNEYDECTYCGGPLPVCGHGLDRLDHKKGYNRDNITTCCRRCNQRKGRLEQLGFKFPRTVELLKELIACEK